MPFKLSESTDIQHINLKEISTPGDPSAGYRYFYVKSDGNLYLKDSGGTETQVGIVTLVNAKGDIFVATADNSVSRLPVGTDGQHLEADSNEATGVKWADAGGGSLPTLSDVDASLSPSGGELLVYHAGDSEWKAALIVTDANGDVVSDANGDVVYSYA